jgi:hypothetical protein
VAARLAGGRPAVERTQTYVQACHTLGYQHPDLTAHCSQVLDWYETETGLDLRVLDDDSAELRAALNTIDEALWLQRAQITEIAAAWTGTGADSATRFLQRHCDIAAEVAAHVRAAAEGYAALRDKLWELVDRKTATVIAIDDRRLGERPAWLAAAHTVTAGAGDRSADDLVRQHVIPYVDNDIRTDWLAVMRSTAASVHASYDAAIEALSPAREVCFEIPGELGPQWQPVVDEPLGPSPAAATAPAIPTPTDIAPTVPAAASAPVSAPPPQSAGTLDNVSPVPPELAAPIGDAAGLSSGAGDLGSLGGLAGGIGGVVGKIVDGIGGLLSSLADGFSDPSRPADPLLDDPLDTEDPLGDDADNADDDNTDDADDTDTPDGAPASADQDNTADAPAENQPATGDPVDEPVAQQVTPPDAPSPEAPPAPVEPQPDGSTPCEIAEDELPQAGQ